MKAFSIALVLAVSTFVAYAAQPSRPAPAGDAHALTIEQLIDIRHPSNAVWSPDGRRVAFLSERAGIANIYVALDRRERPGRGRAGDHALRRRPERRPVLERRQPARLLPADGRPLAGAGCRRRTRRGLDHAAARVHDRAVAGRRPRGVREGRHRPRRARRSPMAKSRSWCVATARLSRASPGRPTARGSVYNIGATTIRHEQTPEYSGAKIIYTISERRAGESLIVPASGGTASPLPGVAGAAPRGWIDKTPLRHRSPVERLQAAHDLGRRSLVGLAR